MTTQRDQDLNVLKYAGLGGSYASVRTYNGKPELSGEYSSQANAKRLMGKGERLYAKTADGWKRVRKN